MTAKEKDAKDVALIHKLHDKYYKGKDRKVGVAGAQKNVGPTRNEMMLEAKERKIKNFRILNRAELTEVLDEMTGQPRIDEIVYIAVRRWKDGWGNKKKEVASA